MRQWLGALCLLAGCAADMDAPTAHQRAQDLIGGRALRSLDRAELAQAEVLEAQALERDPAMHEATFALAGLYAARGAYEEATECYRGLVEARPDEGPAYADLAFSLAAQGRHSAASTSPGSILGDFAA